MFKRKQVEKTCKKTNCLPASSRPEQSTNNPNSNKKTAAGYTPLHTFAYLNANNSANCILQLLPEVNATTDRGWTALHLAAINGNEELVKMLLESSIDPNIKDNNNSNMHVC